MKSVLSKSALFALIVVLSGILISTGCYGCCRQKHISFEKRADKITDRLSKELDLAQPQKEILNKIKLEVIQFHKVQKEQTEKINNEIAALLKGNEIDKDKLTNLMDEKKDVWKKSHEEMRDLIINKIIEFHKILRPEQKEKLAEMFKKHLEKHHRRMRHGF
jgi:protein CpxP